MSRLDLPFYFLISGCSLIHACAYTLHGNIALFLLQDGTMKLLFITLWASVIMAMVACGLQSQDVGSLFFQLL